MRLTLMLASLLCVQDIDDALRRLRSEEIEERHRAADQIRKMGRKAIAPLRKLLGEADKDAAALARALLDDLDIGHDGLIAFQYRQGLHVVDAESGRIFAITESGVCWSWSGKRLLVFDATPPLLPSLGDHSVVIIPAFPAGDRSLIASPDGRVLYHGGESLWRVVAGKEERIGDGMTYLVTTPNGAAIVGLETVESPRLTRLLRHDLKSGKRTVLTTEASSRVAPAVSADGKRVAFVYGEHVCVVPIDGGETVTIGKGLAPSWSPDGRELAFEKAGVWVADAEGKGARRIADGGAPSWAPDSKRLAFEHEGIWICDADGKNARRLCAGGAPAWSR